MQISWAMAWELNRLGPLDTLKDNREASSKVHILWTNIEHMRELDKPVTILMI
jgi:hypothetical protein